VANIKFKSIFLVITMMLSQPMLAGCFEEPDMGHYPAPRLPSLGVCVLVETNINNWSIVLPAPLFEYEDGVISYHPLLIKLVNESDVESLIIDGHPVVFSYRKYSDKFTIELSDNLTMTIRGGSVSSDLGPAHEACSSIEGTFTLPKFIWQTECIDEDCNQIPIEVIIDNHVPMVYLNGTLAVFEDLQMTEYATCWGSGIWYRPFNLTQEYITSDPLNCTFIKGE
jgi:hypothetical protein